MSALTGYSFCQNSRVINDALWKSEVLTI